MEDAPELLKDVDPGLIGRRASRGVLLLLIRYGGVQLAGLIANIALSRLLAPSAFGIYAITLALLVVFAWLSDFGLGAALLQKRETMTASDLRSVFTVQQIVLVSLVVALFLAAPQLALHYHMEAGESYFRAMAIGALFASLKTVPNIVLERKLLYAPLTIVEIIEVLLFQAIAVLLAYMGQGPWSFIWAVLVSKAVGVVLTFVFAGWRPSVGLSRNALGGLWWFALPFQVTWITYIFRDSLIPIVGGLLLNTVQVGYLNWAFALAGVPGQMAQIVGRVSFPSFSRLQDDPARLSRAIESSLRALFLVAIPAHLAVVATGRWLIDIVFTDKWLPALIPLYLLSVYWAGTAITSPLVSALNALGRVRSTLVLNILWTIAQVGLSLVFLAWYGYAGFALAFAVVRLFAIVAVVVMLVRILPIRLGSATASPLIASIVMAGAGYAATLVLPERLVTLLIVGAAMVALYAAVLWLLEKKRLREDIAHLQVLLQPVDSK